MPRNQHAKGNLQHKEKKVEWEQGAVVVFISS